MVVLYLTVNSFMFFNDENTGKKFVYRLNINTFCWERCSKIPEWDWSTSFLNRFQYSGMSVVLVDGKAIMHGDFGNIRDNNFAHLQKNLLVFNLENF